MTAGKVITRNRWVAISGFVLVSVGLCIIVVASFHYTWHLYRNTKYAIAFRYPANWGIVEEDRPVSEFLEQALPEETDPDTVQEIMSGTEGVNRLSIVLSHPAWAAEIRVLVMKGKAGPEIDPETVAQAMEMMYKGVYYDYTVVSQETVDFKGYKAVRRESTMGVLEGGVLTASRLITIYTTVGDTFYDIVLIAPSDVHVVQVNKIYTKLLDGLQVGPETTQ